MSIILKRRLTEGLAIVYYEDGVDGENLQRPSGRHCVSLRLSESRDQATLSLCPGVTVFH
jgi:hypothetical protein